MEGFLLRFFLILSGLSATACRVERLYTRIQSEDGLGMKAPITHTVRLKVDLTAKTVTWMQDLRDARGVEARDVKTYGADGLGGCEVFDEYNWSCTFAPVGQIGEAPAMKDGRLSRFYWVKVDTYETKYRVLGLTFPAP